MARHVHKLDLDPATVRKARSLARKAGRPVAHGLYFAHLGAAGLGGRRRRVVLVR